MMDNSFLGLKCLHRRLTNQNQRKQLQAKGRKEKHLLDHGAKKLNQGKEKFL